MHESLEELAAIDPWLGAGGRNALFRQHDRGRSCAGAGPARHAHRRWRLGKRPRFFCMRASAEPTSRRDWQEIFCSARHRARARLPSILLPWLEALPAEHARLSPMLKALLQAHAGVDISDFMQAPATFALPAEPTPQWPAVQSLIGPYRLLRPRPARRHGECLARKIAPIVSPRASGFALQSCRTCSSGIASFAEAHRTRTPRSSRR